MAVSGSVLTLTSEQSKERSYLKASNSCISGLCTGALAAAAICSSTSVTNLLPAAVHSVRVSFRTGQCALEVGQNIVAAAGGAVSEWSVMFLGMTAEEAREAIEALSCAKVRLLIPMSLLNRQLNANRTFQSPLDRSLVSSQIMEQP